MTVMIVEDDSAIRENISELLNDVGYRPICAEDGRAALSFLRAQKILPDVILLDLMMPVMSGWEFRAQQLQDPKLSNIPVVVVSAMDDQGISATAKLPKPFCVEELLTTVERVAQGKESPFSP